MTVVRRRRPVTLMYHGFRDEARPVDDPHGMYVPVGAFRDQLAYLGRRGWRALDLDGYLAVLDGHRPAYKTFLVTIDDGFASVARYGAEVLAAAAVPSVLFVPVGLLGQRALWLERGYVEEILEGSALRALGRQGMEIGVHGWDHHSLADIDDDTALARDVTHARDQLADVVGYVPRAFAYPYGHFSDRAVRAVERAGYEVGFSVHEDCGRFAVSRSDVSPEDSLTTLRIKIMPGYRHVWRASSAVAPVRRVVRHLARRL